MMAGSSISGNRWARRKLSILGREKWEDKAYGVCYFGTSDKLRQLSYTKISVCEKRGENRDIQNAQNTESEEILPNHCGTHSGQPACSSADIAP